jgi:hypothetical protein
MSRLRRPTAAILATLLTCLTLSSSVTVSAAQAGYGVNRFAAIAYSPLTGRYGYFSGALCRADAEAAAILNTGACDARVLAWVENGWVVLARSSNGIGYGVSTRSLAQAEAIALLGCARDGCPGVILAWAASG